MWVAIDIDGVIGDHVAHLINVLKMKGVLDRDFSKEDVNRWDSSIGGYGFKEVFEKHLLDADFIMGIPVIEGAPEVIKALKDRYNILIVTARPDYTYDLTREWLDNVGVVYDKLLVGIGDERVDLGVDVLIDDNPYTVSKFALRGGLGVIFNQPWNESLEQVGIDPPMDRIIRVYNWVEIGEYLLSERFG